MHWRAWQDPKVVQEALRRLPKLRPHKRETLGRQGCVAAPNLFNCVVDHLMSRVCAQIPVVSFGNVYLADLEYAEDTILLSNDIEKLTAALSVYDRESRKLAWRSAGWKPNWCMLVKAPILHLQTSMGMLSNLRIRLCIWVRQLPTTCDPKPEIERRRALSSNVMQALRKPLWRQQSIPRTTKMRIYNTAVLSVLLYDAET